MREIVVAKMCDSWPLDYPDRAEVIPFAMHRYRVDQSELKALVDGRRGVDCHVEAVAGLSDSSEKMT